MFHLVPLLERFSNLSSGFFSEWFEHQRIEQVALLPQGNGHECHVSKNDLPALHCGSFNCGIDLRQPGKYATLLKDISSCKGCFFPLSPENSPGFPPETA